jgi:hypothetical protein
MVLQLRWIQAVCDRVDEVQRKIACKELKFVMLGAHKTVDPV